MSVDPGDFRLAVFLSMLAAMLAAEGRRPARAWEEPRWRRLAFHGGLSLFNTALTRLVVVWPLAGLLALVADRGWGLMNLLGLSGPAELALSVVAFDCYDYWWHRANHSVPLLWRFHRVHHADTHVDATTALRFHPGELCLSGIAKAAWILAWGPSLWAFALCETAVTAAAEFHHGNVDLPDRAERAARALVMTPRLHAAHHTVSLRTRDANFSTLLLAWDRLFGTLREADYGELRTLGLPEGRKEHLSPAATLLGPLRG